MKKEKVGLTGRQEADCDILFIHHARLPWVITVPMHCFGVHGPNSEPAGTDPAPHSPQMRG